MAPTVVLLQRVTQLTAALGHIHEGSLHVMRPSRRYVQQHQCRSVAVSVVALTIYQNDLTRVTYTHYIAAKGRDGAAPAV